MAAPPLYLVAYDVRCPRRWRRAFKLLGRHGARSQLSVFLVRAEARRIRRLAEELERVLDEGEDALLVAPVDERAPSGLVRWGRTGAPPEPRVTII